MSDERVVPGKTPVVNVQKHIARYNLALQFCVDKHVMDVACGVGYGTHLISKIARKVDGYDISKKATDHAMKEYSGKKIAYYTKDLMDVETKPVDVVVSFETIEHLKDLNKTQEKLLSFLKPGGLIVYSVPLNEDAGDNEHHHHTFDLDTADNLFPSCKKIGSLLQYDISFFTPTPDWKNKFSYFIGIKQV